jgi:hypothetical protein
MKDELPVAKFRLGRVNDIQLVKRWQRITLAIILGSIAVTDWTAAIGETFSFTIRAISVLTVCGLLLYTPRPPTPTLRPLRKSNEDIDVQNVLNNLPETLALSFREPIPILLISLLAPAKLRRRVIEELEIDRHSVRQITTLEYEIPSELQREPPEHDRPLLLAITLRNRPHTPDELKILDAKGATLRVLDQNETLECLESSVITLLLMAYREDSLEGLPSEAQEVLSRIIYSITTSLTSRRPLSFDVETILALAAVDRAHLMLAADLMTRISNRRPVIIEAPSAATKIHARFESTSLYRIRYGDSGPTAMSSLPTAMSSLVMAARVMSGSGLDLVSVDLSLATTAQEYELWIRIPDGYYVKRTSTEDATLDELPFIEILAKNSIPYAHLRLRSRPNGRGRHSQQSAHFQVMLGEIPPGQSVAASLAALIGCATVWLFARTIAHSSSLGTDAPALLLAAPAAAASWLGIDAPTKKLSNGPLRVRLSLLCTFTMSIMATSFFVLHQAGLHTGPSKIFVRVTVLGVAEPTWIALVAISALNLVSIASYAIRETRDYLKNFKSNS